MSCDPIWTVWCDVKVSPGCPGWCPHTNGDARTARQFARGAGWKRKDGQDICPPCQKAMEEIA